MPVLSAPGARLASGAPAPMPLLMKSMAAARSSSSRGRCRRRSTQKSTAWPTVVTVAGVNPVSLARHDKVLATVGAVKLLEERLQ